MNKYSPYNIIISRHITEKSQVLLELQNNESNASVRKFKAPKYVFKVRSDANKQQIARAVEEIYADKKIRVVGVNTVTVKPKARRVRGRAGMKSGFKKAIVTLEAGDKIEA